MPDATKAICTFCNGIQPIHYEVRDVALSDGSGFVPQIRVGICDVCDKVIAIPQEAASQVRAAMEAPKVEPRSIAPASYNTSKSVYDPCGDMECDRLEKGS